MGTKVRALKCSGLTYSVSTHTICMWNRPRCLQEAKNKSKFHEFTHFFSFWTTFLWVGRLSGVQRLDLLDGCGGPGHVEIVDWEEG